MTDDIKKFTRARMAVGDMTVLNPDNIQVGEPIGLKIEPGETVPTVFRLRGSVEDRYGSD